MRVTGQKDPKVFHGYQRNAVGVDLVAAVDTVHQARKRAGEALVSSASPAASPGVEPEVLKSKDLVEIYDLTS